MIRIDETTGQQPSERLMQEMGKLMDELTRSGKLVATAGLTPTKQGKRMRSDLPKVLHPLAGRPMIEYLMASLDELALERTVVVVGEGRELLAAGRGALG